MKIKLSLCALFALTAACGPQSSGEMDGLRGPMVHDERPASPPEQNPTPTEDVDSGGLDGPNEQAIGFYSSGKMTASLAMPFEGEGFLKLSRARNRFYATYDLIELVKTAAKIIKTAYPNGERLQIGDIANQKGGQCASHASHQNGLDADIVYYRKDHREMNPEVLTGFDEKFVKNGRLTENFDMERNWAFFSVLVSTGRIKRMFVDQVIKKSACEYAKTLGLTAENIEILRRLRLEPLHDDHVHIRITCPKNSPNCQQQLEPPEGSGCEGL